MTTVQLERQGVGSDGRRAGVTEDGGAGTHHRPGLCPRKITIGNGSSFLAMLSSTSTGGTKINETFLLSENSVVMKKMGLGLKTELIDFVMVLVRDCKNFNDGGNEKWIGGARIERHVRKSPVGL